MDTTFWIGIGIGAALSLLASIIANIYNVKILSFLEARKLTSHSKHRAKAERLREFILDLRSGRTDRYMFMMRLMSMFTVGMTVFAVLGITFATTIMQLPE